MTELTCTIDTSQISTPYSDGGLVVITDDRRKAALSGEGKRYYDAAQSDRFGARHWSMANGLDAISTISPDLATVRNRCRLERRNNSQLAGIIETYANDIIGNGPTVQIGSYQRVEDRIRHWARRCDFSGQLSLAAFLRLCIYQLASDSGEVFIVKRYAADGRPTPQLIEADRVATPWGRTNGLGGNNTVIDGIEYNGQGQVLGYYVSREHPGAGWTFGKGYGEFDFVPVNEMIHYFRMERPGQHRGMPWITSALNTFGELRDYNQSVLKAARRAANISVLLKTDTMGDSAPLAAQTWTETEIPEDTMLTLPETWDAKQLDPKQPAVTFAEFHKAKLNEAARCLTMPFNIAACNSSGYNYSSGQLDHLSYFRVIEIIRRDIEDMILEPIIAEVIRWIVLTSGTSINAVNADRSYFWKNREHADPVKMANARKLRLESGTSSLADELATEGKDYQRVLEQLAVEKAMKKKLGLVEDKVDPDKRIESLSRAARAGIVVTINEGRAAIGLPEIADGDRPLRFNNEDILQYHIKLGVVTVNEVRSALGLEPLPDGDKIAQVLTAEQTAETADSGQQTADSGQQTADSEEEEELEEEEEAEEEMDTDG